MPLGSRLLTNQYIFDSIIRAVELDESTPSLLRWRMDYAAKRVTPGTPAGSFNRTTSSWEVNINRISLHARHVAWMIANGRTIPEGHDVRFKNGDAADMSLANLVLEPKNQQAQRAATDPTTRKFKDPYGLYSRPGAFHTVSDADPGVLVYVTTRKAKRILLCLVDDQFQALAVAMLVGVAWGVLTDKYKSDQLVAAHLPPDCQAAILRQAARIYTPYEGIVPQDDPSFVQSFKTQRDICMNLLEAAKRQSAGDTDATT